MKDLKLIVQEKYSEIATQSKQHNQTSCCGGTSSCGEVDYSIFSDDYTNLEGYLSDADLGLGCGIPTEFAQIKKGNRVLDLGSGAGNDCFVACTLVGEEGDVTGLDFTDEMLVKANQNLEKTGFRNVHFVKGDIEEMPLADHSFDVVISNCVLNLVPDKKKAFAEVFRVLKPGGHFCISDVVISGELPEKLKMVADLYAGCVSGALPKSEYLNIIEQTGFGKVQVQKEKEIQIPNNILLNYLSIDELRQFKHDRIGVFSITVFGIKE